VPSKCEALSSSPRIAKNKYKESLKKILNIIQILFINYYYIRTVFIIKYCINQTSCCCDKYLRKITSGSKDLFSLWFQRVQSMMGQVTKHSGQET
jgi:hypothetical protein